MKGPQVLVVGGGIAGLCAAISARRAGARVLLVESAPRWRRGGNSRHGRNFRFCHDQPSALVPERYQADEFTEDLARATAGTGDAALTRLLIERSRAAPRWLLDSGVALQERNRGTLPFSRKTAFLLGGGQAMVNALYAQAERLGVDVRYGCVANRPCLRGNRLASIELRSSSQSGTSGQSGQSSASGLTGQAAESGGVPGRSSLELPQELVLEPAPEHPPEQAPKLTSETLTPDAVVLACGGAQGNPDWLRQHCGERVEGFINRGTPEAHGKLLIELLAAGAQAVGDPSRLYLVAVDARSPPADGGIVTRIRGMPQGMVVDRDGLRRHDEGADRGSTRYARWGQRLADYPGQIGYLLLDAAALREVPAALYPPLVAPDLQGLARQIGMDAAELERTWLTYNAAMRSSFGDDSLRPDLHSHLELPPHSVFPTDSHRDLHPDGSTHAPLDPPRTGPARALDTPPFAAYPMRPGLTFTYHGLAVDARARVQLSSGEPIANLFAAGTLMAPNLCPQGYLSGLMLTIGQVFGVLAGEEAARHVRG
ncbi:MULTISPECIES: FAD-dependent oxidoreductase [Thiorhodovibrio]|uniref:FAD-dependent oxidoreductase n=1 Tax=Thiorhodovibrio TaxID=61593 RepID=UPI001912FC59|nr:MULTISPECIES: FAD-dependent oxidoreductase [Thiorhodovibrio]MBK5970700.1 FAD-binding dehydrogenase [Thiorhodovibrio winogradskyi]